MCCLPPECPSCKLDRVVGYDIYLRVACYKYFVYVPTGFFFHFDKFSLFTHIVLFLKDNF